MSCKIVRTERWWLKPPDSADGVAFDAPVLLKRLPERVGVVAEHHPAATQELAAVSRSYEVRALTNPEIAFPNLRDCFGNPDSTIANHLAALRNPDAAFANPESAFRNAESAFVRPK